ncbi:MAG TPA: tetratricopeptide repeat protein, partial [Ardenticatenaceae bacterium]|nr:tetratricopeptide repeat protein [Ardenticatenaceae bacterium]
LGSLIDKHLLRRLEEREGRPRYVMLETIREYAGEKLLASGDDARVRDRHSSWFLRLVEEAEPGLVGPEQAEWLRRLEADHDNLRAALDWALESRNVEGSLRFVAALWWFWVMRGYLNEARVRLARALSQPGVEAWPLLRAKALNVSASLARRQGDFDRARSIYEESLALSRQLGDKEVLAYALGGQGYVLLQQGDAAAARLLFEECVAIRRELGDLGGVSAALRGLGYAVLQQGDYSTASSLFHECLEIDTKLGDKWAVVQSLTSLGEIARLKGEYAQARTWNEQGLALCQELGEKVETATILHNLGQVALAQGDVQAARAFLIESLNLHLEMGTRSHIPTSLAGLAGVAGAGGVARRAVRLIGASEALVELMGVPLDYADRAVFDQTVAAARGHLDKAAFEAARAEGRAMGVEEAVAYALEEEGRET